MSKTKCFTCRKTINREHTQKFDYSPTGKLRAYHLKCRQHAQEMTQYRTQQKISDLEAKVRSLQPQHETAIKPRFFGGLREKLARVLSRTLSLK